MMLAYPGYTVEEIRRTLSWRQVGELIKNWKENPPPHIRSRRLEKILLMAHKIKFRSSGIAGDDNMDIRQRLTAMDMWSA